MVNWLFICRTFIKQIFEWRRNIILDKSNYTKRGESYDFYIEGIGRSLNFSISYKGVFTAFYTHMKRLYN